MKSIYFILILGSLLFVQIGKSQTLYAMTQSVTGGSNRNFLASVNPLTGSVTIISPLPLSKFVQTGVSTIDPIHKRFYYMGPQDSLFMVDLTSGAMLLRKKLSSTGTLLMSLIEFNRTDSLLYGMASSPQINGGVFLTRINPFTGSVSVLSSTLSTALTGGVSTFDHINNRFYYTCFAGGYRDTIYTVNLNTGTLLSRNSIAAPGTSLTIHIEFNDTDLSVNAIRQSTVPINYLVKLNPATGSGTLNNSSAVTGLSAQGICSLDPLTNRFVYINNKTGIDTLVVTDVITGTLVAKNPISIPANHKIMLLEYAKPYAAVGTGINITGTENFKIDLFPNPATSQVNIKTDKTMRSFNLMVFSADGKQVKEFKNVNGNAFSFSVIDLPAGTYFIKLMKDNHLSGTQKIVITN